jgi:hypothetical protein
MSIASPRSKLHFLSASPITLSDREQPPKNSFKFSIAALSYSESSCFVNPCMSSYSSSISDFDDRIMIIGALLEAQTSFMVLRGSFRSFPL